MGSTDRTILAVAIVASCVLHGVVLWGSAAGRGTARPGVKILRTSVRPAPLLHMDVRSPTSIAPVLPSQATPVRPVDVQTPVESPEPRTDITALDASAYVPSTLLDTQPEIVEDIPQDVPELRGRTETGTMILTLFIDATGRVQDVVVEESTLPPEFAHYARRDFLNAQFSPGQQFSRAVPSLMRIELTISPPGAD